MKRLSMPLFVVAFIALFACSYEHERQYEAVKGDPMESRIYTLDNGLKVYLTVNKETPRIQTYIPVRVGGRMTLPRQQVWPTTLNT